MRIGLNTIAGKMLASGAVLASAATVAGLGTFGTFTSTTSASTAVSNGTVTIALGASGVANRLNLPTSGLVPGDTVQRAVDLTNTGNQALTSIGLTTTATPSTLLDTAGNMALHMMIDSCAASWSETVVAAGIYTYTCSGGSTSVLGSTNITGTNALPTLNALTAGGTDHLRVTLTLPAVADNTLQGLSTTLGFGFIGTQRAASAH